jgi:hypothetical protein
MNITQAIEQATYIQAIVGELGNYSVFIIDKAQALREFTNDKECFILNVKNHKITFIKANGKNINVDGFE